MFGIKSRKRIKELETEIKILKSNWELDVKNLHSGHLVFKNFSRQQLVDWIIKTESAFNKVVNDKEAVIAELAACKAKIKSLEASNKDYEISIDTLKSKLTRKKK